MVPLVPKVAALYTVKGVVVPDPLPKVLLPEKRISLRILHITRTWVLRRKSWSRGSKRNCLLATHLWLSVRC